MHKSVYGSATIASFLVSIAAAAAGEVYLTDQQKQTLMQVMQTEKGQTAPAGFLSRIGAAVPQSISVRPLPADVARQVPAALGLEYAKLDNDEILLIDPKDMRVANIIMPSGTTGAAPAAPR